MSNLNPKGIEVEIGGEKRFFLFTLNSIMEIQDHYDLPLTEVIDLLTDKRKAASCMRYLVFVLLNEEYEREKQKDPGTTLKKWTEKEVGNLITQQTYAGIFLSLLQAYGLSLPEKDEEDDDPNTLSALQKSM